MSIGARHIENKGFGYNTGYTTLETFFAFPIGYSAVVPFIDLRGHLFNDGKWAANGGIGARTLQGSRIYGAYAYYDYRNTKEQNYNQISFGVETLGNFWDIRLNAYVPFKAEKSSICKVQLDQFVGNHLLITRKFEYALAGVNGEFGMHLVSAKNFGLYSALGPYYFTGSKGGGLWGGAFRLKGSYKNWLSIEGNYSYDATFKNIVQGQLAFTIPFGPRVRVQKNRLGVCKQSLSALVFQPVEKNEIIAVNHKKQKSVAINPATGEPYLFLFVDPNRLGEVEESVEHLPGTFENPFSKIEDAENVYQEGNLIYVLPQEDAPQEFMADEDAHSGDERSLFTPALWSLFTD